MPRTGSTLRRERLALPIVVAVAAVLATALHRTGHTQGDDFALYLRQARSLFDGDTSAVIEDNRFAVLNSDDSFSPVGYPWVWPMVLAPFVRFWGLDYDRLKLVEVGLFCIWLTLMHGIVRRRIGRWAAIGFVVVFATAPAYLTHTEQLITEIPHLASVGLFLWWLDRMRTRSGGLIEATTRDLVVLGSLATLSFNVRREGLVLIVVIAAMQVLDLLRTGNGADGTDRAEWRPLRDLVDRMRTFRWSILTPHLTFAVTVAVFQLLLPTTLLPDNGNGRSNIPDRLSEFPAILSDQVGLGDRTGIGVAILLIAVIGAVVGVRARPHLDGAILVLAIFSSLGVATHFREIERYWFQVTPWVLYFVAVAFVALAAAVAREHAVVRRSVAIAPLVLLLAAHAAVLPGEIRDVADFEASGSKLSGPTNERVAPIYETVEELTPPDAIIAFMRARTMTLLTDRRSLQTKRIELITERADYFAQRRDTDFWQPQDTEILEAGYEQIWSDPTWILWRIPEPGARSTIFDDST